MSPREFSDTERKAGLRLLGALECFKEIRHTMPLQYVLTFMLVALEEGKSIGEYASKSGVSPSVMSRHVLDIGMRARMVDKHGAPVPGFDLVYTKPNINNLREHSVWLTDKGRALYHKLCRRLEG